MPLAKMVRQVQSIASRVAAGRAKIVSADPVIIPREARWARWSERPAWTPSFEALPLAFSIAVVFVAVFLIGIGKLEIERAPPARSFDEPGPGDQALTPRVPPIADRFVQSPLRPSRVPFVILIRRTEARGTVVDGDTLAADARRIRLHGIDAPEIGQTCRHGPKAVDCGALATDALWRLVAGRRVTCTIGGSDRYNRDIGTCFLADGTNVNERMVEQGWALAYGRYTPAYDRAESYASDHGLGLWSYTFVPPEEWRRTVR